MLEATMDMVVCNTQFISTAANPPSYNCQDFLLAYPKGLQSLEEISSELSNRGSSQT